MTLSDRTPSGRPDRRRPSLRLLLTLAFLVLLLVAVGVTGTLLIRNSQRGVDEVTSQLRREITGHAHEYVSQFLETPHRVNRLNADVIRRGLLDVHDAEELARHFWYQRGEFEDLSFLFFGTPAGGAAGAGRNSDGVVVVDATDVDPVLGLIAGTRHEFRAGPSGERDDLLKETPGFDARRRPWFEAAVARRAPVWSDVYPFFAERTLAIAASEPVYGSGGELLGVLGADLGLDRLAGFLRGLRIGDTGRVFILERASGLLVASSSQQGPLTPVGEGGEWQRLAAVDSSEPLIAATAQHLAERFGSDLSRLFGGQVEFELHGERQLVDVVPLTDPRGIDWLIVVAVPQADFAGQIAASTRATLWLCLAALAAALLAAVVVARSVTRPLLDLTRASRALAGGRLDQRVEVGGIGEVEELAQSFNVMADRLESSFEELEGRVDERTAELSQAKEAAVIANRRKTDFLSTVSHEVRTPLAAILGYADLLTSADASSGEMRQWVTTIRDNGEHLGQLVDDLLDLNRIESGVLELDEEWIELSVLLARLHSTLAARTLEKRLSLRLAAADALPEEIRVDPRRLGQVLLNLLGNAVKYTAQGTVTLAIGADPGVARSAEAPTSGDPDPDSGRSPDPGPDSDPGPGPGPGRGPRQTTLELRVVDTGAGIPAAELDRLFEPFTRLGGSHEDGVGLGLAISRRLVERMGGSIEALSAVGVGSEFVVRLPVDCSSRWRELGSDWARLAVEVGSAGSARSGTVAGWPPLRGRVLVADDSTSLRDLVVQTLGRWGLACDGVADGREAVEAAREAIAARQGYDVILLDWQMPRLDGLGALAELRACGVEAPVVMLTAAASVADRERSLAAGCAAHVAKPLRFGGLHEVLAGLLPAAGAAAGDEAEVADLVERYTRDLPTKVAELRAAADSGDTDQLRRIAHRFAGTAGSFGLGRVAELAAAVEAAAQRRETDSIASLLEDLAARVEVDRASGLGEEPA